MRRHMTEKLIAPGAALMLLACALGGCGYSLEPLHPTDVKTVAVPMWQRGSEVYRREIEMRLTEALVKEIELATRYKVVSRAKAQTELTGSIDRIEQRVLTFDPDTGMPRELEMTVFVTFQWKDLRKGTVLVERSNFSTAGTYITGAPFNRDFFQGSEDVLNKLARRIVQQMETSW